MNLGDYMVGFIRFDLDFSVCARLILSRGLFGKANGNGMKYKQGQEVLRVFHLLYH